MIMNEHDGSEGGVVDDNNKKVKKAGEEVTWHMTAPLRCAFSALLMCTCNVCFVCLYDSPSSSAAAANP